MFKKYIKDIVETEVIRLCDDFDKYKTLVPQLNDVIHQQNSELSNSYNTISSLKESIENTEGKLILKGNLLSEQKEANSNLTEKLLRIESLINYYESFKPDYYTLLDLVESIKNILKES